MFYPRGYVVLAFSSRPDAEQVRQSLVDGGYDEDDVRLMDTAKVLEGSSADLEHLSPLIKSPRSSRATRRGRRRVKPSDLDTERLMNVARRVGYVSAQKYDRFTFTQL